MKNSEDVDIECFRQFLDELHEGKSCSLQSLKTPNSNTKQPQNAIYTSDKMPKMKMSPWEKDLFSLGQDETSTETILNRESPPSSLNQTDAQPPEGNRLQILKASFRKNLLIPQKIVNPKKDRIYKKQVFNRKESAIFNFGELGSSDEETEQTDKEFLTERGKILKKELETKQLPSFNTHTKNTTTKRESTFNLSNDQNKDKTEESFVVDSYSGIRIVDPLVSCSTLQQRMKNKTFIKMSIIPNDIKDVQGHWVTMGVIVSKVPPKASKNGKPFSVWKVSDLHDPESPIRLFLFTAAHTEHWKATVGTVIAILDPSIVPNKLGKLSIAVDHPRKLMLMGKSKDLGFCKSKRTDGNPCNTIVNKFQFEHCTYHIKKEFKKFSIKRIDSSSYYEQRLNLKNKLLKGSNIFYGGKSFTAPTKKAQLAQPSIGSKNLLQPFMKEKPNKEGAVTVISPKELLQMRDLCGRGILQKCKSDSTILKNLAPPLGQGLRSGHKLGLESSPSHSTQNLAKVRAIQKIKEQGQLRRKDPNYTKVSFKSSKKVKAVLEKSLEKKKEMVEANNSVVKSTLGSIDFNSEKVKAILKRESSHAYEVEMTEMRKEASYFSALERKEEMEEKMASTKAVVCDVVSCLQCKYTADTAADRCKTEQHCLKCHKALKRFFVCKDCKRRTITFSKFPKMACRRCYGSNFERTSMMNVCVIPKYETLNISGDDSYFLNSL